MPHSKVRFTVSLTIPEANLAKFQSIAQSMIAGSQSEPGTLAYDWHFSPDNKSCRLIEEYADAKAVEAHTEGPVVKTLVPKMLEVSTITSFEVYGDPGPKASQALSHIGAHIYSFWQGMQR
jgi:quinol monooxygenase YgiN